jgi:hypothetical protein
MMGWRFAQAPRWVRLPPMLLVDDAIDYTLFKLLPIEVPPVEVGQV